MTAEVGVLGGLCNRKACRAPGATWYNSGSYAYYCPSCAFKINEANPSREPLCKEHNGNFAGAEKESAA